MDQKARGETPPQRSAARRVSHFSDRRESGGSAGDEWDEEDGVSRRPVIAATLRAASNPLGRECKGLSESGSRSAMQTPEFAMHGRE
jgi:hypothetical protein